MEKIFIREYKQSYIELALDKEWTPSTPAPTERFINIYSISELIPYYNNLDFYVLPHDDEKMYTSSYTYSLIRKADVEKYCDTITQLHE